MDISRKSNLNNVNINNNRQKENNKNIKIH